MSRYVMPSILAAVLITACAASAAEPAKPAKQPKPFSFDVYGGAGFMAGDVTYQIGGDVSANGVSEELHFPISELKWPTDVAIGTIGASFEILERFEVRASYGANITSDAGTMEDSDWEYEDVLTIYSESDAELEFWQGDASARYWFFVSPGRGGEEFKFGAGAGVLYQDYYWEASNLDQWYPPYPWLGHDYSDEVVITYDVEMTMPYFELAGKLVHPKFTLEGRGGVGYVQLNDVDDHKLRYIRAETETDGAGVFFEGIARYYIVKNLFLQGTLYTFAAGTQGTEQDVVYAGEDEGDTWEIEHEVTIGQIQGTAAIGLEF